ncbi:MAG: hypothetical protein NTZ34_02520 [Chloroflexi bacterium]|nr:hypothetical protein [Chloroflexota bacterium]
MSYTSVDQLQKVLAEKVFHYAKDSKKAAGRALGTLVEIITFYLLKSWGFERSVAIERALAEFGNPEITHNVEYSLHPVLRESSLLLPASKLPLTSTRVLSWIDEKKFPINGFVKTGSVLLTSNKILRNSCIIGFGKYSQLMANLKSIKDDKAQIAVIEQHFKPYAIFECKRVGVEEGMGKGPQTIEKAKQGAYVAKSVSSLHKIRLRSGELYGLIYKDNNKIYAKPYAELAEEIITSSDPELLRDFILTVGIVSNHGNWFTSDNHNKELKVLAQSYDWLIFLTDEGLSAFITELLLDPVPLLKPARTAFLASYTADKQKNQFTKVQMDYEADQVLQAYFKNNKKRIGQWFNVIAPNNKAINKLQSQLATLRDKNWKTVHSL